MVMIKPKKTLKIKKSPLMKMTTPVYFNKYRHALIDPFDERCRDVRLPNDFAVNTVTRTVTGFCTLGAGLVPNAYLFTPSPIISVYSPAGNLPTTDMISYNSFTRVYQAIDQETLRNNYSSWRMVAGGIRIKSAMPITASPLVISVATAPVVGSGPGPSFLNDGGAQTEVGVTNIIADIVGTAPGIGSTSVGWGAAINGFSNYNRFTTQDVSTNSLTIPFRVTDARAFDFKSGIQGTGRGYVSNVTIGDSVVYNSTTGAINTAVVDNEENYQFEGFAAIALDIKGMPSVSNSVLEVEYIYHLEGIPAGKTSTTRNAVTSGTDIPDKVTHLADIAWANRQGLYKVATSLTGSLFTGIDPNLIQQLLGIRV